MAIAILVFGVVLALVTHRNSKTSARHGSGAYVAYRILRSFR